MYTVSSPTFIVLYTEFSGIILQETNNKPFFVIAVIEESARGAQTLVYFSLPSDYHIRLSTITNDSGRGYVLTMAYSYGRGFDISLEGVILFQLNPYR
jgi:hypothetical protein